MPLSEKISLELHSLPEAVQQEVLDFVEFLKARRLQRDDERWADLSLRQVMRGLEDEPDLYSPADVRDARR